VLGSARKRRVIEDMAAFAVGRWEPDYVRAGRHAPAFFSPVAAPRCRR